MINKTLEIQIRNMKAGKEIDEMIANKIFGVTFVKPTHGTCCTCQTCGWDYDNCMCGWSTNLDKAWEILSMMGNSFFIDHSAPKLGIDVKIFTKQNVYGATADTIELAICKAALFAIFSE